MLYQFAACVFLLQLPSLLAYSRLTLSGDRWTLSDILKGTKVTGKVPGTAYTALRDKGQIKDPLYRDNDVQLAWIGQTNWTFSTLFTVSSQQASAKQATLVCEGLDTVATVSLNGKVVGKADNMFIRWEFNVTGIIKQGTNSLTVDFTSAVAAAAGKARVSNYTIPPDCPPAVQHGECHVNQIRKQQSSFSWAWGPSFPTQGIWKPIYIETFDSAILSGLSAVVSKVDDAWQVEVDVEFDVSQGSEVKGQFQSTIHGLDVTFFEAITVTFDKRRQKFRMPVPKTTDVPLWWPNGYGQQPLFTLKAQFVSKGESTTKSVKVGFRTVELIQTPVAGRPDPLGNAPNSTGQSFYFKVNGVPVFLKGSNWIPADSFQERITRDHLQYLLSSAANVSINTLRVWGGGVYESDDFYELCDELGLLVWQDFMFTSALYPSYPGFLESVLVETQQQVRRLKYHPSIFVWAGNDENELALREDRFKVKEHYKLYYKDYLALYVTSIKPVVEAEDPTRVYLTSSPSNGAETVKQGYVAKDPNSEFYGDFHYYYPEGSDQWNASTFRIPRMATQYGIQSWCNFESLAGVFQAADFDVKSKMVDHRQHSAGGNARMMKEIAMHLSLPQSTDPQEYFEEFIYLSQINQAMAVRAQTEHYRRHQSAVLQDGRGLTMGALNLQLNDVWQGPTWSSIDYSGRWKMLHYFYRDVNKKYLVSPYKLNPDTVDIYLVMDQLPALQDRDPSSGHLRQNQSMSMIGDLLIEMYTFDNFRLVYKAGEPFEIKTRAESIYTKPIKELIEQMYCHGGPRGCIVRFTAREGGTKPLASSWFLFTDPKDAILSKPDLKIRKVLPISDTVFNVSMETYSPALFVWLSAGDIAGHFSDNGFHMFTAFGSVLFYARQPTSAQELLSQLRIRSLENKSTASCPPVRRAGGTGDSAVPHWSIPRK